MQDTQLFLAIVEAGTLQGAARIAGIDPSLVSRRLNRLEDRLGVKLFDRSRGRTGPTEDGLLYYERMKVLLEEIDAVEADVALGGNAPRGVLRVAAPIDFGAAHVGLWMNDMTQVHSELQTALSLSDDFADPRESGLDVVIRIGALSDSELMARKLGIMTLGIFGSPALVSNYDPITRPEDLERIPFVHFSNFRSGASVKLTHHKGRSTTIRYSYRQSVNNLGAAARLVADGAGLHVGPTWFFGPLVETGVVERVLPDWEPPRYPVHALYAPTRHLPARVRAFIDLAVERSGQILSRP